MKTKQGAFGLMTLTMDDHPQATSTFPDNTSLFTSYKGYKVVMVTYGIGQMENSA
jgi:hypothetical protein